MRYGPQFILGIRWHFAEQRISDYRLRFVIVVGDGIYSSDRSILNSIDVGKVPLEFRTHLFGFELKTTCFFLSKISSHQQHLMAKFPFFVT